MLPSVGEDGESGRVAVDEGDAGGREVGLNVGQILGSVEIAAAGRARSAGQSGHVGGSAVLGYRAIDSETAAEESAGG